MKLLVTGAEGLLGSEVVSAAARHGDAAVGLGRAELDVTDAGAVASSIESHAPEWVVHCAAYTAVDGAEADPELAMTVNRDGTRNVVDACARFGSRMAYVSTDYVFGGDRRSPYRPDDPVDPRSAYARSKADGEALTKAAGGLVVRTGWLYGAGGGNFVRSILGRARRGETLRIVDDQTGRPTWARNAAETLLELMERGCEGVWHVADGGQATWMELATAAIEMAGLSADVAGVSSEEWGAAAVRPSYSVLDLSETESLLGSPPMHWTEALRRYMEQNPE